ncbi:hypothetical protein WR25_19803 [Diploscapter pachys]|uniref:Mediator of RNA polymerase II transcription subunit 18 n=1 Tax=Diploscapter pachys TaxID=2018661 RepID=A0A2A2KWY7_9BILA|nr:hypothetical protein WR25_19803 [Diploscapter pachys]
MSKEDEKNAEDDEYEQNLTGLPPTVTAMPYQSQECILYGTLHKEHLSDLERRISGLCDPGVEQFSEHEMAFSLRTGSTNPDVTIRLRRRFRQESFHTHQWQFRYIGMPEPDQKCPTIVRKVIDSVAYSPDMMHFAKTLGLRMDYEYMIKGSVWTCGKMKITAGSLQKTDKAGTYDKQFLKDVSDSYIIEISTSLPEQADYMPMSDEPSKVKEETGEISTGAEGSSESQQPILDIKQEGDVRDVGPRRNIRIAVAGCSHGEMDRIYETMAELEREEKQTFDLLVCCGDYQAVRNYGDLHHVNVPDKYRQLMTFYKYYSGEKVAPVLTLFVGGNHEASGFLAELPNGGWVAPKIYYMGYASVIRFAGLRIAGLSGIYGAKNFRKGHYERPPFGRDTIVTAYHVREVDVFRLKQLKPPDADESSNPIDIMISHDWPGGIYNYGNVDQLLRYKKHFKDDINSGRLGNPATMQVLQDIRPRYWFAAHLHCAFAAMVDHPSAAEPTRFLSLDKPIVRRHFLHSLEIEVKADVPQEDIEFSLSYDPHWLAILKSTDHFTRTDQTQVFMPSKKSVNERWDFRPNEDDIEEIRANKVKLHNVAPENYYRNPQTAKFCQWLGISDLNKMLIDLNPDEAVGLPYYMVKDSGDENEIKLDDSQDLDFGDDDFMLDNQGAGCGGCDESNDEGGEDADEAQGNGLGDFEAPKWKGNIAKGESNSAETAEQMQSAKVDEEGGLVLKRRKVDLQEEDD